MFYFALLLGIYSYIIFGLGIAGILDKNLITWLTIIFWGIPFFMLIKTRPVPPFTRWEQKYDSSNDTHTDRQGKGRLGGVLLVFIIIFSTQALVNLIGALGPELAFDALWYHLTIPKIWLSNHAISFIPGGLLYYSAMPKVGEMLYIAGLSFGDEITVKLIHYSFGILTSIAIYRLSRKFFTPLISLIAVIIFYSNLVVSWESITAYIDLIRTFFEIMALWAFINWWGSQKQKWLIISAIITGLAITTKLLAIGSLLIFFVLILIHYFQKNINRNPISYILYLTYYIFIALIIPLPWFLFSYIHTGNPVYPFFTGVYPISPSLLSITAFFQDTFNLLAYSQDPLSPIYLILLPLIIFYFSKFRPELKIIAAYSFLAIIFWYFTPRTGGGRFILPYLSAFSILCAAVLSILIEKKRPAVSIPIFLITLIIIISSITIAYRFFANSKYIPVLIGQQTKTQFLSDNLNFSFGDFYDTDGYFEKNISQKDKVLLYGFHNLYYVNFPFIDSSWLSKKDKFNYIATQNAELPDQYKHWILIYSNNKTMIELYRHP